MRVRRLEFWDYDQWTEITKLWPKLVVKKFGSRLREVQLGGQPASGAKPVSGFKIPLWELWHRDGQRVVYTTHFVGVTDLVYVLDAFEKDSREGREMRRADRDRIANRVKRLNDQIELYKSANTLRKRSLH